MFYGSLVATAFNYEIARPYLYSYLDGLGWRIQKTAFTQDEVPSGWRDYCTGGDEPPSVSEYNPFWLSLTSEGKCLVKKSNTESKVQIDFTTYLSSEAAQMAFKAYGTYDLSLRRALNRDPDNKPVYQPISGIGDMALLDLNDAPSSEYLYSVVDRVTFEIRGFNENANNQTLLSLGESTIKYLARLGVTTKKP